MVSCLIFRMSSCVSPLCGWRGGGQWSQEARAQKPRQLLFPGNELELGDLRQIALHFPLGFLICKTGNVVRLSCRLPALPPGLEVLGSQRLMLHSTLLRPLLLPWPRPLAASTQGQRGSGWGQDSFWASRLERGASEGPGLLGFCSRGG